MDWRRLLPGGPYLLRGIYSCTYSLISSYTQQSSFNHVKSNWDNPSYKKDAKLETLHYYVLHTLFSLPGYLDNQCGEFLKQWMANHGFREFPDLIG